MFRDMNRGEYDDRVFMQRKGIPYKEVPTLFRDIVKELGFNNHVSDSRQRVCFHSLRHSMASWHAEAGTDLYVIKELLGHGSIALTERYSHLSNGTLQKAAKTFEQSIQAAQESAKAVEVERTGS
jgi:site-specific recombinase XerD